MADQRQQQTWLNDMGGALNVNVPPIGGDAPAPSLESLDSVTDLQAVAAALLSDAQTAFSAASTALTAITDAKAAIDDAKRETEAADLELDTLNGNMPAIRFSDLSGVEPPEERLSQAKILAEELVQAQAEAQELLTRGDAEGGKIRNGGIAADAGVATATTAKGTFDTQARRARSAFTELAAVDTRAGTLLSTLESRHAAGGADGEAIDINAERQARTAVSGSASTGTRNSGELDGAATSMAEAWQSLNEAAAAVTAIVAAATDKTATVSSTHQEISDDLVKAMTQEAEASKAVDPDPKSAVKIGPFNLTWKTEPKLKTGPLELEVSVSGVVEAESEIYKSESEMSAAIGLNASGVEAELKGEIEQKLAEGVTAKEGAGITGNFNSVQVGAAAELKLGNDKMDCTGSVNFVPIGVNWAEADVQVLEFSYSQMFNATFDGPHSFKIKVKLLVSFKFSPNWTTVAQKFAERFGPVAAGEAAIVGGMIAAGAATIGIALYQIMNKDEIAGRADAAKAALDSAAAAYQATLRQESVAGGPGANIGIAEANRVIAGLNSPKPDFVKKAKERNLQSEAVAAVKPGVRSQAISMYWAEHYVEKRLAYPNGLGNGGFQTFKITLDAALR